MKLILILFFSLLCSFRQDQELYDVFEKKQIATWEYPDTYPELQELCIDCSKSKRAQIHLTGSFPCLRRIILKASHGCITAVCTGNFPEVTSIDIQGHRASIELDLQGTWERDITVLLDSKQGRCSLLFPQTYAVTFSSKRLQGKVIAPTFHKTWNISNKEYVRNQKASKKMQVYYKASHGVVELK